MIANFKFSESTSGSRTTSAWNAFVAYHAEKDDDFSFTPEYMAVLKEKYSAIDSELQKKVEFKKKMIEMDKQASRKRPVPPSRVALFESCVKDLTRNVQAMFRNFQHHVVFVGQNGLIN